MEYRAETRTTRLLSAADMKYYILFDHCYRNDKLKRSPTVWRVPVAFLNDHILELMSK